MTTPHQPETLFLPKSGASEKSNEVRQAPAFSFLFVYAFLTPSTLSPHENMPTERLETPTLNTPLHSQPVSMYSEISSLKNFAQSSSALNNTVENYQGYSSNEVEDFILTWPQQTEGLSKRCVSKLFSNPSER